MSLTKDNVCVRLRAFVRARVRARTIRVAQRGGDRGENGHVRPTIARAVAARHLTAAVAPRCVVLREHPPKSGGGGGGIITALSRRSGRFARTPLMRRKTIETELPGAVKRAVRGRRFSIVTDFSFVFFFFYLTIHYVRSKILNLISN